MPDQIVQPRDRFLDAGAQRLVPLFEQGISFGDAIAGGLARAGGTLDAAKGAFQPDHCRVESLFRHEIALGCRPGTGNGSDRTPATSGGTRSGYIPA